MRIAIAADHAGFALKEKLLPWLAAEGHEPVDFGTHSSESCDYPLFAERVAREVAAGRVDRGILVCSTGIGMAMAANKVRGVRATPAEHEDEVRLTREHNDANVLTLGAKYIGEVRAAELIRIFLNAEFQGGRHARRVAELGEIEERNLWAPPGRNEKIMTAAERMSRPLAEVDPEVYEAIQREVNRQDSQLELIASENFASEAVLQATASVFTNKYAEGYPGKRYYGGCEFTDVVENLARDRAKKLFGAEYANVQPHSGSQANQAAYAAVCSPGDVVMGLNLAHGGHLTHGHKLNFSGKTYEIVPYGVRRDDERIDYDEVERLAREHRPKMIIAGGSAYPRTLDFPRLRHAADSVGAVLLVDMAHFSGLVAAGLHPNPCEYADIVTSTTHKTLRGPRAGIILAREKYGAAIDKSLFPGVQGGPLVHVMAAKAVCFLEALQPEFKEYQKQVLANARALAESLMDAGFRVVSGGTDTHLLLLDVFSKGIRGRDAEQALDRARITVNKNAIPFDVNPPMNPSGIRLGSPAVTTRGFGEAEMREVGALIAEALGDITNEQTLDAVRRRVGALTARFPLYAWKRSAAGK
jgi:glycine hydroxymethyltransferase